MPARRIRRVLTNVPLVLPTSSKIQPCSSVRSTPCRQDTRASSTWMSAAGSRPT
jgi:hypothetical protein